MGEPEETELEQKAQAAKADLDAQQADPAAPNPAADPAVLEAAVANLEGRETAAPMHGFGRLWRRTYRVPLAGADVSPEEVVAVWKERFPDFQPPANRFLPTSAGVQEGALVFVDSNLVDAPGLRELTPMSSGLLVIRSDATSFTVMTPEGFPVSGYNTFSAYREDGVTIAQVQGFERASDPLYELGYRFLGGEAKQDETWQTVLRNLAQHFGAAGQVTMRKECMDGRLQWRNAGNIWKNAAIRTFLHRLASPLRKKNSPQMAGKSNQSEQ